jgi:hypothetical protein
MPHGSVVQSLPAMFVHLDANHMRNLLHAISAVVSTEFR